MEMSPIVFNQRSVLLLLPILALFSNQITAQTMPRQQGLVAPFSNHAEDSEIYSWLCPHVMCQPLSKDCMTAEFIVFKYSYKVNGKIVDVRCESCAYCMDPPKRRRRNVSPAQRHLCPQLSCPLVPYGCQRVRMVDLLFRDISCRRCPACFDNNILANDPQ